MNLKYFQIQKGILQAGGAEKEDKKTGVICVVFMLTSRVTILILSKKVRFFNFCWLQPKNINMLKHALSENVIVYYAMT